MKRIILLAMVAFMAMLVLAPMAMAQDTTMMMEGGSRMPSVPAPQSEPRHVFSS